MMWTNTTQRLGNTWTLRWPLTEKGGMYLRNVLLRTCLDQYVVVDTRVRKNGPCLNLCVWCEKIRKISHVEKVVIPRQVLQ